MYVCMLVCVCFGQLDNERCLFKERGRKENLGGQLRESEGKEQLRAA